MPASKDTVRVAAAGDFADVGALLDETIRLAREAGAVRVDLGTGENDAEARGLYESAGFTNYEDEPGGPRMLFYEREI